MFAQFLQHIAKHLKYTYQNSRLIFFFQSKIWNVTKQIFQAAFFTQNIIGYLNKCQILDLNAIFENHFTLFNRLNFDLTK